MNKRIRKLAEQAGIEFDDDFPLEPETIYYLKLSDFEKFAELIVRECLAICEELGDKGMDGHYCADEIARHFRAAPYNGDLW